MGTRAGRTQESNEAGQSGEVPDVTLLNQDREEINLRSFLDTDKPVIIDFISTTCNSVCPALSEGFSGLRDELGDASNSVRLVSISIDPEHDGPEQMKSYLAQYNSGEGWDFLTGSVDDIAAVLEAFNASPGSVLSAGGDEIPARSFYLIRGPFSYDWLRINGDGGGPQIMIDLNRINKETDSHYNMKAKVSNTVEAYEEYIRRFPKGDHLKEITQLLNELEDSYYAKAQSNNDFYACKEYLNKFPNGRYVAEINKLLDKSYENMMEFVSVRGDCYQMGDSFKTGGKNERPVHEVCVNDFFIGKYDVTVGDFKKFVADAGYVTEAENGGGCYDWTRKKNPGLTWRNPGFAQDDRHPVVCVSWNDAVAFAEWLTGKTGKKYRLPSEAEWEYAARSGGKVEKYAGVSEEGQLYRYADFCDEQCVFDQRTANQDDGYKFSAPVGSHLPNGLGLHDMTGNVLQWVNDWYGQTYYSDSPKDNPAGPDRGEFRILRGGSWYLPPLYVRSTCRLWGTPAVRYNDIGFRLASPGR